MGTIRTVGHGTLEAAAFADLVRGAGIEHVVDVRRFPGSRRHPHFGADAMPVWLDRRGVSYTWLASLGGRREPVADSRNVRLRNAQFRGYADHMASDEFAAGVAVVTALASRGAAAVMCAESVWWRCHRRLLADHLVLVGGIRVEHLFPDGRSNEHRPAPEARRVDEHVVYDVAAQRALFDPVDEHEQ